jgi:hypothetical protein
MNKKLEDDKQLPKGKLKYLDNKLLKEFNLPLNSKKRPYPGENLRQEARLLAASLVTLRDKGSEGRCKTLSQVSYFRRTMSSPLSKFEHNDS